MRLTLHVLFHITGRSEDLVARLVQALLWVEVWVGVAMLGDLGLALRRVIALGNWAL